MTRGWVLVATGLCLVVGCDSDMTVGDAGMADAGPDPRRTDCEALVDEVCGFPWPSDYFLAEEPSNVTGHRVQVGETTLPRSEIRTRSHIPPETLTDRDGFSVNASILTYLRGATATGLPSPRTIERSLEADSPTVLLNAQTGERVPHFSELDESMPESESLKTFIIRPVVPLEHATRYIVAIRGVVDADGNEVPPSEVFAAFRDDTALEEQHVEARRAHFEGIFSTLSDQEIARAGLQAAWDFTTCSQDNDVGWMLEARDAALAAVGEAGPTYRIDEIEEFDESDNENIARRVHVLMEVPLYLTNSEPDGRLNLNEEGALVANGTAEFPMVINVPRAATPDNPVRPLQYGHGLLGARGQANAGWLAGFANDNGYLPFGLDMIGMSESDLVTITIALANGQPDDFRSVPDRLIQGVVNHLLAMRLLLGRFAQDEAMLVDGRSIIDTSSGGFYIGDSQGGILGATLMAVNTDVTRGVLGVPGQPYNLLLNRSVDFDVYASLLDRAYSKATDIQLILNVLQQLWDRSEPGSYTRHIETDLFENTPSHRVLLQLAIGDHQVSALGAHIMARAIGAVAIAPQTRPMWGIEEVSGPHAGSAIVEFDYGLPEVPITNIPMREGEDPHQLPRRSAPGHAQIAHFFETGEIIHTCDGPCDPD